MADLLMLIESNTTGTGELFARMARELGLAPHMICSDPNRYPYLAELGIPAHRCDTSSVEAVIDCCRGLARHHPIAGVTTSSELYVVAAAAVARALSLPGEDPERLAAARDKSRQRESFAASGVDVPRFGVARSPGEAVAVARRLGTPVVVKPVSRSGSVGVRQCRSVVEVARHTAGLLATTTDERGNPLPALVLVESYLAGPEFSVEILAGRVRALVAKHVDESVGFLEVGHDVPAGLDATAADRLAGAALAAVAALGLTWGAAHVELRLVDGRPFVVEVNPRLAGGMIPHAVQAATGQDLITELVARSAGRTVTSRVTRDLCASIQFVVPAGDGEIGPVPDAGDVLGLPGVLSAALTARTGQWVRRSGTFLDRMGYVIAVGETVPQARARAERAAEALAVPIVRPCVTESSPEGRIP